jgi:hypothetical protein
MNSLNIDLKPEGRSRVIAGINVKLGCTALFAVGSVALWPDSIEWWGYGVHSILLGMGAVIAPLSAIIDMVKLRRVEQTLGAYGELGTGPKGSHMADGDAMRAAGMQDAKPVSRAGFLSRLRHRLGGAS